MVTHTLLHLYVYSYDNQLITINQSLKGIYSPIAKIIFLIWTHYSTLNRVTSSRRFVFSSFSRETQVDYNGW